MTAYFNRFAIEMTKAQAESASHQGPCDDDVAYLLSIPKIRRQLDKIGPAKISDALRECGGWIEEELADEEKNRARIVWIAACNIREG
jgi:hypothetical protein